MVLYFGNPSTGPIRERMRAGELGCILTPKQGKIAPPGAEWVADNGCGPGKDGKGRGWVGEERFLAWLLMLSTRLDMSLCQFAVAPDVVGDAAATVTRSVPFLPLIREMGYPVAFVGQNGLTSAMVPWDGIDVLFLGGSAECVPCGWVRDVRDRGTVECPVCWFPLEEWKMGDAAAALAREAVARGKRVHMGRVSSLLRMEHALFIGCDTVDGTHLTNQPDVTLPEVLGWQDTVNNPRRRRARVCPCRDCRDRRNGVQGGLFRRTA